MDLKIFSDPEKFGLLSFGEKMLGSTMVTILGMGITFVGLIAIMFLLSLSSKLILRLEARLLGKPAQVINQSTSVKPSAAVSPSPVVQAPTNTDDVDSETVAAIMAALTVMMQTSTSNIVIRNIKRVSPEWNKAGKIDQFASRF